MNTKLQQKEYRLCGDLAPIACVIKTGGSGDLLVFDKDTKLNRAIRHCRNEKSIYLDEQSDFAKLEPIIFQTGYLRVEGTETITKAFLDIHPDNKANGGSQFEEVNDEVQAKETLEMEDIIVDLKYAVREKQKEKDGLYDLQALVAVIKSSYVEADSMSMPELRKEIYHAINSNPLSFLDEDGNPKLFDEGVKRKYIALKAIGMGDVKVTPDGRSIIWSDTKNVITGVPSGLNATDYFADYLETDDGILVLERLMESL